MTYKKSLLLFGFSILFISGCLFFRPIRGSRPVNIPREPSQVVLSQPATQAIQSYKIYLTALEDAGKSGPVIGCNDSLVAVEIQAADKPSALQKLLDQHNQNYGQSGLYNALYQSNLTINRFESSAAKIEVYLAGNLTLGGVCDNPRVEEQLKATIRQSTDDSIPVIIRINGVPLADLFSQK